MIRVLSLTARAQNLLKLYNQSEEFQFGINLQIDYVRKGTT